MSGSFESVCAQTRLLFTLSSERVFFWGGGGGGGGGMESEHMLTPKEKNSTGGSMQDRTRNTASRKIASPTHYRLSYSGPTWVIHWIPMQSYIVCDLFWRSNV